MNENEYYYRNTQTYCCSKTLGCFGSSKLYISTDIVSPAALAHLADHMQGKEVGCCASKWTSMYPSALTFEKFLKKCRHMQTTVRLFHYTISRPDLDAVIEANSDIITKDTQTLPECHH